MTRAGVLGLVLATLAAAQPAARARDDRPVKVGLALSGGAALGLAHIGVLKVLEREGIPVGCISGNSMGAMVGGVYAAGYSAAEIESLGLGADWDRLFSAGVPFGARYLPERQQAQRYILQLRHRSLVPSLPSGLVPLQNVEFLLMDLLAETEYNTGFDFDSLPIPFRAVAVDLVNGRREVMRRGRLAQAIRASIAIPGVFAPERLGAMELVDGGVQQYLPVDPLLEFEPDFIIAVQTMRHSPETGISVIDVASRSMDIINPEDLARQQALADVLIEPDVEAFTHSDFARVAGLVAAGERAAEAALPEIRRKLRGRLPVSRRRAVPARPLAIVRRVEFDGLVGTREGVLQSLVATRPGRYLLFGRLRRDLERLFNTGLFSDVNYRLEFGPGDSVDVTIELTERAFGFYSLGIRYDNYDNVGLGIEVGQGNLWGSGAGVRAVAHLGDPNEFRLGLTGTRLFLSPFGYRVDASWSSIDRSYLRNGRWRADYNTDRRGGVAEAGYILGRNAFFNIGVDAYQARHRFPPVSDLDSLPAEELVWGPRFRFEFDSHDDPFIPTRGLDYAADVRYGRARHYDDAGHRLGVGGFLLVDVATERIVPLGSRVQLRPGYDVGVSVGALPWAEQFHTGGTGLPGFANDEFTSRQRAVGRLGLDLLVAELFGSRDYPLYVQLGACLATFRRVDLLLEQADLGRDFDWVVTAGFLTNTPVGPFRVVAGLADFGKPSPDEGGRVNVLVSLGRDFRYTR